MVKFFKVLAFVVVISCIFMSQGFAESPITVKIDGEEVNFTDAVPYIDENNRTQVPLRAVAEAFGCDVEWDGEKRAISITKDYTDVNTLYMWTYYESDYDGFVTVYEYTRRLGLTIGSNMMTIDSNISLYGEKDLHTGGVSQVEMDTSPILKDNRTYLPVRYVAETFGCEVNWDPSTKTVNITSKNSIDGTYISDHVSMFEDMCAIGLYDTDYTAINREFVNVEKAEIIFKDGRTIDVTDSFIDATDELKEAFTDWRTHQVAYAGKVEYDFSQDENKIFKLKLKVNVADKEGNIGYQTYVFYFDITDGQGGYL